MEVIRLDSINSTNKYAKVNIDSFDDKTVIVANSQTEGRGRLNRSWVDLGEGNLFLSIVLKPSQNFSAIYPNLTQYLSVSLCKVLEKYDIIPQIKWPNDVLVDGKKIAGILSETVFEGQNLKGIILGIGVNLNANQVDIDLIPNKIATALNLEVGMSIDLEEFINLLLSEFFQNYDEFLKKGFSFIRDYYLDKNCFLGNNLEVQIFNDIKSGLAQDVNDSGELILKTDKDEKIALTIGDIL